MFNNMEDEDREERLVPVPVVAFMPLLAKVLVNPLVSNASSNC